VSGPASALSLIDNTGDSGDIDPTSAAPPTKTVDPDPVLPDDANSSEKAGGGDGSGVDVEKLFIVFLVLIAMAICIGVSRTSTAQGFARSTMTMINRGFSAAKKVIRKSD
jgi:hypothetical protein